MLSDSTSLVRSHLPDIASNPSQHIATTLDWVGMDNIDVPASLLFDDGNLYEVQAQACCYVSLDNEQVKGIHMSRLYRLLNEQMQTLTPARMHSTLNAMIDSHRHISCDARIQLNFDLYLERPALLSDNRGWKRYPVSVICQQLEGQQITDIKLTIPYSSTCPCSASLARQLLAARIREHFSPNNEALDIEQLADWLQSDQGSVATPHSQRSYAYVKLRLRSRHDFPLLRLIDGIEHALKTPVQTSVKRIDEQEFARLNGENLMFCEDAARRIKQALKIQPDVVDYWLKVEHQESLHPHNAVAIAVANVAGGFSAQQPF